VVVDAELGFEVPGDEYAAWLAIPQPDFKN
jgi:hypothetical protein